VEAERIKVEEELEELRVQEEQAAIKE